jgi:hypothetical protein
MKRSHPGKAIRTGPTTGIRADGPQAPPLAKARSDDYGETVMRPLNPRRPPIVEKIVAREQPVDLDGFAQAAARHIMKVVEATAHPVQPEDAA